MPDGFGTDDGPESREEMEIPGFPRPQKAESFSGSLQVCLPDSLCKLAVRTRGKKIALYEKIASS